MAVCGTVEVTPRFTPESVSVVNCSLSKTGVRPGETVTATATVQNNNPDADANATLRFSVDGTATSVTETVSVQAGGSASARVELEFTTSGEYPVSVSLQDATQV